MRHGRAIASVLMVTGLMLAACESAVVRTQTPILTTLTSTSTILHLTNTTPLPTATSSPVSTTQATLVPCNLSSADFCVEEAYFLFQSPFASPGNDRTDRGYPYGSNGGGSHDPHHGVEFANPGGTPVRAAADGRVYYSGDDMGRKFSPWSGFYGNIILIEHPLAEGPFGKLYTLYAHLSKIEVNIGQIVSKGDVIGKVGMTGTAFGNHLHFEVRVDPNNYASTLNPELWLVPHPGNGALALLATDKTGQMIFPTFNIQFFPDRNKPATSAFQLEAYTLETTNTSNPWKEVAAIGDLHPGWYRVTLMWDGILNEKWVEIQPGKLTRSQFSMK